MATKHDIKSISSRNKKTKTVAQKLQDIKSGKQLVKRTSEQKKSASDQWISRHLNDPFVQASKADGFVSRAAYKIIEMNDKYKLLKKGDCVIDIGCAPGSWMQVVWDAIKDSNSKLIGIDLLPINIDVIAGFIKHFNKSVFALEGDFMSTEIQEDIENKIENGKANVIVSDMAPNTTGIGSVDHLRIVEMLDSLISFAYKNLAKHGNFVAKVFDGSETNIIIASLKKKFRKVLLHKPLASRSKSSEIYLVALDYNE